tara:strand:+ start:288 stop:632 length:345 start_codon:yes stop_codon:yes gene_type:complete
MKLSELKNVVKNAVKEAIQEEMKDILLEAVRSPKQVVSTPAVASEPIQETDRLKLRENMMNVLDGMRPGSDGTLNATSADVPMQVTGPVDNANGSLPQGNVSMDQIMGLMNQKG